jgi:hypothetical protein
MERPNPFYRRSRISAKKFRQLLRLFALDLTATDVAQLTGLTRVTSIGDADGFIADVVTAIYERGDMTGGEWTGFISSPGYNAGVAGGTASVRAHAEFARAGPEDDR